MKKSHLIGALCAVAFTVISMSSHAVGVSGQGTWETTLQGRDLDGNAATFEAYYDTVQDITWLANANAGAGSAYDDVGAGGYDDPTTDGRMTWANANAWAASLNINGVSGWRLPATVDVGNDGYTYTNYYQGVDYGYNITTHSEMSHMFYVTLGNLAFYDTSGSGPQTGFGLTNTGPFTNLQSSYYWSATEYAPDTNYAWGFLFLNGGQGNGYKGYDLYAWAVHSGDVGAAIVPVPAAVWLFGSGLLGLIGLGRQRRR